jgi:hypothetical protein
MAVVAKLYYVEQCAIVALAIFMIVASTWQLKLQSKDNKQVKSVPRVYMRALFLAGILELAWSIDPRGIWRILSAVAIAFIKDYVIVVLSFCGLYHLDAFCRVVFESLGRSWFLRVSNWLTCGIPLLLTIIVQVWLTVIAIKTNLQQPRNYFMIFLGFIVLLWTLGITCSLVYIYSVRQKSGLKFSSNAVHRKTWIRLIRITVFLWIVVVGAILLSIAYVVYNVKTQAVTLLDTQVAPDSSHYEFYTFFPFHILGAILVFLYGKQSSKTNPKVPAAVTPVASDVIIENVQANPGTEAQEQETAE